MTKQHDNKDKAATPSTPVSPRDGLDNTGTQGADSLTDDAYTGSTDKPDAGIGESRTGSSSEDFDEDKKSN